MRSISAVALACAAFALSSAATFAQPVPFTQEPFTDVPESSPSYEAIEYLRQNNVVRGYPDHTFRPDTRIDRAEFVHLMTNPFILKAQRANDCIAENLEPGGVPVETVYYDDVRRDAWYAQDVCAATVAELVHGYPDGTFRPGKNLIFVEAAKVILNAFQIDITEEPRGEFWYEPYVRRLAELRAIPTSINRFDDIVTRAEVAEILYRVKRNDASKPSKTFSQLQR